MVGGWFVVSVSAGRECIGYTGEVLANWTRPVMETLGDLVKRPMFIDFELRDLVHHYREAVEERERTPPPPSPPLSALC